MPKPLVIVGDSVFAQLAYEFFTHDSAYDVVAFAVEATYLRQPTYCGLPVVAVETVERAYAPAGHHVYCALVYTQLNRLRRRLLNTMQGKGYTPASYVSTRAHVHPNVTLGEHVFITEGNTLHPHCHIADNVVIWSDNDIGRGVHIGANSFLLTHIAAGDGCEIGANSIVDANVAIAPNTRIGADCIIHPGALIEDDIPPNTMIYGPQGREHPLSAPI